MSAPKGLPCSPRHRLSRLRRDRTVARERLGVDCELSLLDRVRVRDESAEEDVARTRYVGQSGCNQATRAGLGGCDREADAPSPARARSPRPAARPRQRADRRTPCAASARRQSRCFSAPACEKRSTWISKSRAQTVISRPLSSPPLSSSARATVDSLGPKKRSTRCSRGRTLREDLPELRPSQGIRPEPPELRGRARESDRNSAVVRQEHRGGGAGEADRDTTPREQRLLAHAGGEVGIRSPDAFGDRARDGSICRSISGSASSSRSASGGRASRSFDRRGSGRARRR